MKSGIVWPVDPMPALSGARHLLPEEKEMEKCTWHPFVPDDEICQSLRATMSKALESVGEDSAFGIVVDDGECRERLRAQCPAAAGCR